MADIDSWASAPFIMVRTGGSFMCVLQTEGNLSGLLRVYFMDASGREVATLYIDRETAWDLAADMQLEVSTNTLT